MIPILSVVMATYNGEAFIKEAIQSVLDQTYTDFEFLIVDDGSTDTTASIVSSFKDERIIYIKKRANTGIANSLNLGIVKAKGQYIARMDDDDVCMPERFEKQLEILEHQNNIVVCGTTVLLKDRAARVYPEHYENIKMALLFSNPITHPTVMMRKDVLLNFPYNSNMVPSEDYDLWSRLIEKGEFYIIQSPLLLYRQHLLSETSVRRREQLQLNVNIAIRLFNTFGFHHIENHDTYVRIFVSRDYSISGKELCGLQKWFGDLKQLNAQQKKFNLTKFNVIADTNLQSYLISYFMNQKHIKKIIPFLKLDSNYKIFIIRYYLNKISSQILK